ncbi:MFS transporter [Sphingomonas lenta]|uniref:MFS transporter n=1 Tax=Sphingomonas lenta TaxID=1141887 RepID=A0A2A2SJC9_9SPHN|nr:MFS transporter [Sphingomonas lenta]PAX09342.1 MFS transporter [Sphingomonas lenta]
MILSPQAEVSATERERGLRNLLIDAAFATAIGALNSGVVLLALAIHIGASNLQIGVLAAIPLLTQILQAPAVTLVERVRRRRLISVACVFTARLALPIYALVPFIPDRDAAAAVLILAALIHYGLNAVGSCSWNSWMRDLLPQDRLGAFFSRRNLYGTAVSAAATVGAAWALQRATGSEAAGDRVYASLYAVGFLCGLVSTAALARVPEPRMPSPAGAPSLRRLLLQPLRDVNFQRVLRYLASWQFAVNLATPFFTVYFVRELGFSMGFVLILSVVSQLANVAVVRGWGRLSDRFANKSVLAVASPLYLLCIAAMAFASEFEGAWTRAGYLVLLHVLMGAAQAGVGLATNNIVIKLSPAGAATGYMATNALVGALASGTAPIVGGWLTDFFARRQLTLSLDWTGPSGTAELFGVGVAHWEFFFLLAAALGLYALHRLAAVDEPGSVEGREVVDHIVAQARYNLRNASSVAGVRQALAFPAGALIKSREGTRFVLESLFERHRDVKQPAAASEAVGTLLDATFEPIPDDEFEALLRKLDERS